MIYRTACLGALLTTDSKGLKITHIYKTDPDLPGRKFSRWPNPNLIIKEGDIITAINDIPVKSKAELSELLANKVGIPVKLSLLNKNNTAYSNVINPISAGYSKRACAYTEWELSKREQVDKSSNNEIGYMHLRAMSTFDMDDFVKQYYPIFNRQGLIIDVRHNNGGNIDSWVLEKLMRKAWFYWQGRAGRPYWNMHYAFRGHMVVICDQHTASDGEAFAEGFRRLGLGKIVGMRTWGGEVWLSQQ
jgi:tricorn protease